MFAHFIAALYALKIKTNEEQRFKNSLEMIYEEIIYHSYITFFRLCTENQI